MSVSTIDCSHQTHRTVLSTIFASQARVDLLRVLLLAPLRAYYQRQLEAATGLPIRAVQRELMRLSSIGLLYRRNEGNRTYYQVNMDFPLFPELRGMVLKTAGEVDAIRGALAMDEAVRLAFLADTGDRVLVVGHPGARPVVPAAGRISVEIMTSEEFLRELSEKRVSLAPYLVRGLDLLGDRDDVIWRHIEAAGYEVRKGEGVP